MISLIKQTQDQLNEVNIDLEKLNKNKQISNIQSKAMLEIAASRDISADEIDESLNTFEPRSTRQRPTLTTDGQPLHYRRSELDVAFAQTVTDQILSLEPLEDKMAMLKRKTN